VIIRDAAPDDAPQLAALHAASWRSAYAGIVPDAAFGAALEANMHARWLVWPEDRVILVAHIASQIAGFASVVPGAPPLLDNLHVDPVWRGSGAGAALMRALAERFEGQGLRLEVLAANTRARAFYRRLGGCEGPCVPDTLLGHKVDMVPVHWSAQSLKAMAIDP